MICCTCKLNKPNIEFSWKNQKKNTYAKECKSCHRIIRNMFYKNNSTSEKARVRNRKLFILNWLQEYKKTCYCSCGENHPAALDFHHKDETTKEINISHAANRGWSINRLKKEINKCVIICANCHRKLHYDLRHAGVV